MSNFDHCNNHSPYRSIESEEARRDLSSPDTLDNLKRDRFELLSAYLDGEVTADERRQVEAWLATDLKSQRLYARLLKLRQGVKNLPVPSSEQPIEQVAAQVMTRLERRPRRTVLWGGMAIAALFVSAVVSSLPRTELNPSIARSPEIEAPSANVAPSEGLMIALDRPVIEIPKAAVSVPGQSVNLINP